jgi:hypothetical protein
MSTFKNFGKQSFGLDISGEVYIETGVGWGDTFVEACKYSFSKLVGIDVSSANWTKCCNRIGIQEVPRIYLYHGTSPDVLPKAIDPSKKTVFWLDAHYEPGCDDTLDSKYGQCPLLCELSIIVRQPWKTLPIILIDDASIFLSQKVWWDTYAHPMLKREDWPTFQQIYDVLDGVHHRWNILIRDEVIYCWGKE